MAGMSRPSRRWRYARRTLLVAFLALVAAWVFSYRYSANYTPKSQSWNLGWYGGAVIASMRTTSGPGPFPAPNPGFSVSKYAGTASWRPEFLSYTITHPGGVMRKQQCTFPLWMPTVVLCVLWLYAEFRTRSVKPPGVCGTCGYSLAGLPQGSVCPECAMAAPPG